MSETIFYNMWRTANAKDRSALLDRMKGEAPALASKSGFISMTVLECAKDGRVLVEGHWQSEDAFNAAVTDSADAQKSRASLEEFGSPEPGLFTQVFRALPPSPGVLFLQTWRMTSAEHQQRWLETMHSHIGILTAQPGFISMALHTSLDGKQNAVYAQWTDEAALTTAISLTDARRAHDEMAKWGESDGSLYRLDSVYLPGMPSRSLLSSRNKESA